MKIIRDNKEYEIKTILEDSKNPTTMKHFKNKDYHIITVGKSVDTDEKFVVYQALYGNHDIWIRKYDEFFSKTDKEKYPDVKQEYRFVIKGDN